MNKTKQLLIDISFGLLYKKGYCATSIVDILKVAKMTKGSLYYHFESKDALVLSAMEHYIEEMLLTHWVQPLNDSQTPIETLIKQIRSLYEQYEDKNTLLSVSHGCPLNNFIQDMSDKNELYFKYLDSVYSRWQEAIENSLNRAKASNQTQRDFNSKSQAIFIISAIEGSIGSAKAYNSLETLHDSFEVLTEYISTL
jgi:AcrR family transcriptional regulator